MHVLSILMTCSSYFTLYKILVKLLVKLRCTSVVYQFIGSSIPARNIISIILYAGTAKVFKQPHLPEEFQGQQAKRDSELQSLIDELELKDILDPEETEGHQGQSVPGFRASPG